MCLKNKNVFHVFKFKQILYICYLPNFPIMKHVTKKSLNHLCYQIIGAAIEVHKLLGPGLLEQVYETCLEHELLRRNLTVTRQKSVPIGYKGLSLDAKLRYDLLIEDLVVIELKAVEVLHPLFEAQLMTYMSLLEKPKGIILNFCCTNIYKEGQKTIVNEFYRMLPEE